MNDLRNHRDRRDAGLAGTSDATTMGGVLALKPADAARLLCVSPRTLWSWTQQGIIPSVRVGTGKRRLVRYSRADLETWLAEQSRPTTGGAR